VRLDFADHHVSKLAEIEGDSISFDENVSLQVSRDGSMVAVTNTYGRHGLVYDVRAGRVAMRLERDGYHSGFSRFPVAFFELGGQLLLVHGTAWNRLDVSDPMNGEVVTKRETPVYQREQRPDHHLDYFHCSLFVSPDQEWIIEDGWIWSPVGTIASWNLRRWVQNNVWDSKMDHRSVGCVIATTFGMGPSAGLAIPK
jgi:hypothetical protein